MDNQREAIGSDNALELVSVKGRFFGGGGSSGFMFDLGEEGRAGILWNWSHTEISRDTRDGRLTMSLGASKTFDEQRLRSGDAVEVWFTHPSGPLPSGREYFLGWANLTRKYVVYAPDRLQTAGLSFTGERVSDFLPGILAFLGLVFLQVREHVKYDPWYFSFSLGALAIGFAGYSLFSLPRAIRNASKLPRSLADQLAYAPSGNMPFYLLVIGLVLGGPCLIFGAYGFAAALTSLAAFHIRYLDTRVARARALSNRMLRAIKSAASSRYPDFQLIEEPWHVAGQV